MIRRGIGVQSFVSAGGGTDADAQAVITAIESTGVTLTATQKTACNTLVTDLKGYGIWTKLKAVYGFLGGTAGAHKWNWKNPADTDAAFRLVFSGGWTHSSTGALPNGTNGYADTFLTPSNSLSLNSTSFSYYSRQNSTYTGVLMGCSSTGNGTCIISPRYGSDADQEFTVVYTPTDANANKPSRNDGLFMASRIVSNQFKTYRNGSAYNTTNANSTSLTTTKFVLGARSINNSIIQYTSLQCAFASIGDGLTDTEAANLYTAVQAYQTSLSRNV